MSRPQHDLNMNAMPLQCNRGDKTAIELFLAGIRALALQSRSVRILTGHAGK
jgi:hypothetical protein